MPDQQQEYCLLLYVRGLLSATLTILLHIALIYGAPDL